jgi:ribose/xylose/arabinose/galactoside ABC-type transport system permease subunit
MTTATSTPGQPGALRRRLPGPLIAAGAWFRRSGVAAQLVALVVLVAVFAVGTGGKYLSWTNIQTILSLAAIPAIFAIGLHPTIVLGGIDLSLQGVASLCAVFVGVLLKNQYNSNDVGLWIIPIAMGIGGLAGVVNGLLNTGLKIPSFISTLGMSWILYGLAVFIGKAVNVQIHDTRLERFASATLGGVPLIAILAVVFTLVVQAFEDRTRFGRYMYAIGGDEIVAKQAGVNVAWTKIAAFTVAGIIYGVASLLLTCRLGVATSRMGLSLVFPTVTAVAVGGVSLTGGIGGAKNAALGALIVTALNDGLVLMHVSPYIQQAVNGVVLLVAVAFTIDRRKLGFIK